MGREHQFVEVTVNDNLTDKIVIGNIKNVRETNNHYDLFMEQFDEILQYFENSRDDMVIFGDFNIDLLKINEKPKVNKYFDYITSKGLIPKITLPTRLTETCATLIDNALCKLSHDFAHTSSYVLTHNISDHQPYLLALDYKTTPKRPPKYIKVETLNEQAIHRFINEFEQLDIIKQLNFCENGNPNTNYDLFIRTVLQLKNKHLPTKYVKFNKHKHRKEKWMTQGILRSLNHRDKMFMRLKGSLIDTENYQILKTNLSTYNKILKKSIKAAKITYYKNTFDQYKNDIKNTWLTIKDIMNRSRKDKQIPEKFDINGNLTSNPIEIADSFNAYFNTIGANLARNIDSSNNTCFENFMPNPVPNDFVFHDISQEQIVKLIENLPHKNSRGIDELSNKFVKKIKNVIAYPLTKLINQSIQTGIFPDNLKIAKIIPVHKKDSKTNIENYRPISLLPVISKIFEKVMLNQIHEHFKSKHLYNISQYGFREGHSTEFAVLENIDRVCETLEGKKLPLNIFLDLSKAFDTLDHNILIKKLQFYGIGERALKLCKSYLTDRKQCVLLNETKSELLNVRTGVPQGSILGPFLFLVYMNDFDRSSNVFKFIFYADDTSLLAALSSNSCHNESQESDINQELQNISTWLKTNRLSLNIQKTKFMVFHPKNKVIPNLKLTIDNISIERVKTFTLLGITIDERLSWKSHTEKISKKISKVVGVMTRLKNYIPYYILKTIYNSLILPHLLYGSILWGGNSSYLHKLQKKAARTIVNAKYNAHTEPIFKYLHILKLPDIIKMQEYKFYYKIVNGMVPTFFLSYNLPRHLDIHNYATRRNYLLVTPRLVYNICRCSMKYRLPSIVNAMPSQIIEKVYTHSIKGFSLYIKNKAVEEYEIECSNLNCYICNT